jgi:hypothetical protein
VRAALPGHVLADEAQVGFVNQGGGLQSVAGVLAPHVRAGEAVQLLVDVRDQAVERGLVAAAPVLEQPRHFSGSGHPVPSSEGLSLCRVGCADYSTGAAGEKFFRA